VEQAFKNLKGDLAIRPVFHQDERRIEAHIPASLQGDFSEAHGAEHALARIQPFYARPVTVAAAGWSP
jgi:hypothetical protein